MRFRLLGATELVADGSGERISSERQRRLLAVLAMRSPNPVATDTLIEAVWGDQQPDNAANALRTVVTRLRHSLDHCEPGASRSIVARPPGYVLDVSEDAIDAHRFADLTTEGRRHLAEGDIYAARTTLQDALGLWLGRPYAEVADEPWAQAEVSRLERLWTAAREADIEARLASGLHSEVQADLQRLIEDEPFSDRPRALLMRALFAGGQQAASLGVFQEYRTLLAGELGLEPGPELVRLEARVLANDPTLVPETGQGLRGYRLHEQLATTEAGAVFRATQPGLEREVAVEVIREDVAGGASFVRSFELQGQALAQLGHAHVVPVYDCWREPGGAYLVRQLLTGGTLGDPEVRERLGPDGLTRVRTQVRSALDVAHRAGLVHGPMELADVQLDAHDTAYLANFRLGTTATTIGEDNESFDRLFDALVGPSQPQVPPTPTRIGNPYRGLSAFRETDVDVFFGRDRLVRETLDTIHSDGGAVIIGPSGSGKSSLVHAGVLPALRAGELDGSAEWFVLTMVPGTSPFAELEAAVLRVAVNPPQGLLDQLRDPRQPLTRVIQRLLPDPSAPAVLVLDQFEELFTLTPIEERDRFLAALSDALNQPDRPLKLIATLRADHYHEPLRHGAIASFVKRSTVAVDAPSGDELRAAIVEPARVVGVEVEPDLVGRLVADASGPSSGLPLLQYTLTELFENRDDGQLTLEAYLAMGGLAAAIGTRSEELYEGLDPEQRETCRRLFGRLVASDVGETRRRARISELRAVEANPEALDVVTNRFVAARLLGTDRDPATREPTLEVAHEALFRQWPRLADWLSEDRNLIALLRHLGTATDSWRASGDESELYRGARLAGALDLVADHSDRLTPAELAFITASQDLAEAEQQTQRRQNRRLRVLLGAAGALLVVAMIAGVLALAQRDRADDRAEDAENQAEIAAVAQEDAETQATIATAAREQADVERLVALASTTETANLGGARAGPSVAILLALEAHRLSPSPETLSAVHRAVTADTSGYLGTMGDDAKGVDVNFIDGGKVVMSTAGEIEIWDVAARSLVDSWPFPSAEKYSVVDRHTDAVPDGSIVGGMTPETTTLIDTVSGDNFASIHHDRFATDLALGPRGEKLAIGFEDGTVEVRTTADPTEVVASTRGDGAVASLAWHPNGQELAMGASDHSVELWRPADDRTLWHSPGNGDVAAQNTPRDDSPALLFSATGEQLVISRVTPTGAVIEVVHASTGEELMNQPIQSKLAFHRALDWIDEDETQIVAIGSSEWTEVFDLRDRTPDEIESSEDGRRSDFANRPTIGGGASADLGVAITSFFGTGVDLQSIGGSHPLVKRAPLTPAQKDLRDRDEFFMLISPDNSFERVITSVVDPTPGGDLQWTPPQMIDLDDPNLTPKPYLTADGGTPLIVSSSLVSSPGDAVLSIEAADRVVVRDFDGEPLGPPIPVAPGSFRDWSVNQDGRLLALSLAGGPVVYDVATGEERYRPAITHLDRPELGAVAWFNPDGETLSVRGSGTSPTAFYDADSGRHLMTTEETGFFAFDPIGARLAWSDFQGAIRFLDPATQETVAGPLLGHDVAVFLGLWSADGQRLATFGTSHFVKVWDLETMTQVGRDIAVPYGGAALSPDGTQLVVSGEDGMEIWEFDPDRWLEVACQLAGRNLTQDEWERFGPRTIDRRATCPQYPL